MLGIRAKEGSPGYSLTWKTLRMLVGGGGVCLLQQAAGVEDQITHLERLYQTNYIVDFEEAANLRLGQVGEGKHQMLLQRGIVVAQPAMQFRRAPVARHLAVYNQGIESIS